MERSIYLSVDLDFFCGERTFKLFNEIFGEVVDNKRPTRIVTSHETMLRYVNKSKARDLLNVDYHSDLATMPNTLGETLDFNCGTWVSFVKWRGEGSYKWMHPFYDKEKALLNGRCDPDEKVFTNMSLTNWKDVKMVGLKRIQIPWERVSDIGICISPDYTNPKDLLRALEQATPQIQRFFMEKRICQRAIAFLDNGSPSGLPCVYYYGKEITYYHVREALKKAA